MVPAAPGAEAEGAGGVDSRRAPGNAKQRSTQSLQTRSREAHGARFMYLEELYKMGAPEDFERLCLASFRGLRKSRAGPPTAAAV